MLDNCKTVKSRIADLYNRVSSEFDRVGPETFGLFGRILVEEAQLQPGMHVLDIGAGRGASLFPAAMIVGDNGLAIGIDLAFEMARQMHSDLLREDIPQTASLNMDAEHLAFPPSTFDALLCGFAIFFLDPKLALPEWQRVLRPGGRVAISISGGNDPRWAWYEQILLEYQKAYGFPLHPGAQGLRQPKEIMEALAQAGFKNITIHSHEIEIQYPDAETWWKARWTHGSRYPLDHMPKDVLAEFQVRVLERARKMDLAEQRQLSCILARVH
jgi:ubiquinone/menaquinone biosynthesis C-methylase UbiE